MKNRRGFTLVELLITITVLGIILVIALPTLTSINYKDISTQEKIYKEALVTSAKAYNDQFSEDLFGRKLNGCAKIPYSELKDKDLIKKMESNKLDCGYNIGTEDSSGIIVRKVKDTYYYEAILWCKNKKNGKEESASNNTDEHFNEIDENYCNESASEDNDPPVLHYTNNNVRYFYNSSNAPKPVVWITDAVSGLKSPVSVAIEWTDPSGDSNNTINTYHPGDGNNLMKKNITLPESLTKTNTNGRYTLSVISKNIQDLSGNVLESGNYANPETPASSMKTVGNPEAFFIENTKPVITTTDNKTWTNHLIPVTLSVNDNDGKAVYSGIKSFTYTVKNNSTGETLKTDADCGEVSTETEISKNNPKNSNQASKSCSFNIGRGEYSGGSYTITTNAEDWAGNINTTTNNYQFDNNPPSLTITRISYNKYKWIAQENGYSGLNGYINNNSSITPTTGWITGPTSSGNRIVSSVGTYYTWVKDNAGNVVSANIPAYKVTRSVGTGTTLTTKYESSSGTAFTNNSVTLKNTPVYIAATLQPGYQNLVIKYGSTTITNQTTNNVTGNVTISTSATACPPGKWNDGTKAQCESCPSGYTSAAGAQAQTECYINVPAGKYKSSPTGTGTTSCGTGYYKEAHKSYYNSSDSCTICPSGYRNGVGTTAETNCIKSVAAGNRVATEKGDATSCGTGYYKAAHNVNYGSTSSCTHCPSGYRNGAATDVQTNCKKSVTAGNRVATAKGDATSCGTGYYKEAHNVNYGSTSSCTRCPSGYRNGSATDVQTNCKKSVAAGNRVATAKGDATSCGTGYYKAAHDVKYGSTSSCTQCPAGYRDGDATDIQAHCKKSVSDGYYVKEEKDTNATKCSAGSYKASHTVNYGQKSACSNCPNGQTCPAGSTSQSACYSPCSSLSATSSSGNCNGCQKGSYYYYKYCKFSFSGCTDGLSGHMCYYNANGNHWCSVGKKYYANTGDTGYGYAEFSRTEWRYYRYTEGVEMNATNSNGNSVRKICNPS